ncbi:hypothetical protein MtrunA17_Chr5g0400731 [Medicago truncatula]|uniref:Uncharacterized protein n=1 Tax=Medicago truncatula TaxID=3880 RepID=A0A396HKR1_MEDTR|nr:hypothetical protein MtrunA17_Chr5g0400731 [Medicago truncatula]
MENAKLWSMVNKLQTKVFDYNAKLTKLEEEVSSLKDKRKNSTNEFVRTIPVGIRQPGKRGRPEVEPSLKDKMKKSTNETARTIPVGTRQQGKRRKSDLIITVPIEARQPGKSGGLWEAFQEADAFQEAERRRGRKPADSKLQFDTISPIFLKSYRTKCGNKEISFHSKGMY